MTINWTSEFDASISLFGFENSSINPFLIFDEFNTTGSYNDFNISTAIAILTLKSNRELWRDIPLGCTLTILSLLTLVGNALVLHAVRTERRLQTVSSTQKHIVLLLKWLFKVIKNWIVFSHEPNVCVWVFTCSHRDLFYLHTMYTCMIPISEILMFGEYICPILHNFKMKEKWRGYLVKCCH